MKPLLAIFACLVPALAAAAPLPEETLLSGLAGDLRHPGLRCEWIAGRWAELDERLSLYREELTAFHVMVDGARVADSAAAAVLAIEFEARRAGPATVAVAIDTARAPIVRSLTPGQRVEIYFSDRSNRLHPVFCGELAFLRNVPPSPRYELVAAVPRAGTEGRTSALWENMTCADVLEQLVRAAGLTMVIRDMAQRTVYPSIMRRQLAIWPFMRSLGRQCRYEIVLQPGGTLAVTQSTFAAPAPVAQQWSNLSFPDIAERLAERLGRTSNQQLRGTYPLTTVMQRASNEEFLASLAADWRVSAWYVPPGQLYLREDGVWNATAPALPAGEADTVLWRITVTGGTARSFTRRPADPARLAADPEGEPLMQSMLLLGGAMPAAAMPRPALADRTATAAQLEAAIARLAAAAATPEQRFLQAYAQAHRPALLHLWRLRPGGLQTLSALGR